MKSVTHPYSKRNVCKLGARFTWVPKLATTAHVKTSTCVQHVNTWVKHGITTAFTMDIDYVLLLFECFRSIPSHVGTPVLHANKHPPQWYSPARKDPGCVGWLQMTWHGVILGIRGLRHPRAQHVSPRPVAWRQFEAGKRQLSKNTFTPCFQT